MFRKLKDLRVILVIIMLLSWIVAGVFFFLYRSNMTTQLEAKDVEISTLTESVTQVGELVSAYVVTADVPSGKQIEESDLTIVDVPTSMSTNLVEDSETIIGKYFKVGLTAGSVVTTDVIYEEPISNDLRYYDVVTHTNPIGLLPGAYVDIRIQMPLGEDYVAIPHRRVIAINSGILKVAITESDIHTYNSMLVDTVLYPGTQIYAVEYIEGGVQTPAEAYYPVSNTILALAQKDPNLLNKVKEEILVRRNMLEQSLDVAGVGLTEAEKESLGKSIASSRDKLLSSISESQREVDAARVEFEKEQARLAEEEAAAS